MSVSLGKSVHALMITAVLIVSLGTSLAENQKTTNLIKCPDCGKDVSRRAVSCPACGCPGTMPDRIYNVFATDNLASWPSTPARQVSGDGNRTTVKVPLAGKNALFLRVEVQVVKP